MKKRLIICTFALVILVGSYGISYYIGRYAIDIGYGYKERSDVPTVAAYAGGEIIVSNLTDLYIQTVDLNTKSVSEEKVNTPVKYIGMTRKQLQDELTCNIADMELAERLKGLISVEVISFEKTKVVIRKTYSDSSMSQDYYLFERDGYVVIYLGDRTTFYDYTDIKYDNLDRVTQYYIGKGLHMENSKELYEFLQNHTS